ncbi:hypothetical protein [Mucilaginibacter sp. HD30]
MIVQIETHYSNASVEALLKNGFPLLADKVKTNAEMFGKRNLPFPNGDKMNSYFETTFHECQGLVDEANRILQFQTKCFEVSENDALINPQLRQLENDIVDAEGKLSSITTTIENTPILANKNGKRIVIAALLIVCGLDFMLSRSIFEQWGFGFFESLIIALLFPLVIALAAHLVPYLIRLGRTIQQQRIIAVVAFVAMTAVFTLFALSRAYIQTSILRENGDTSTTIGALPFIVLSDFCFIVAVLSHFRYWPAKSERDAQDRYDTLLTKQNQLVYEISASKVRRSELEESKHRLRMQNSAIIDYGQMVEHRIADFAKQLYSQWKTENLRHRSDCQLIDCFDQEFPFTFTYYFNRKSQ